METVKQKALPFETQEKARKLIELTESKHPDSARSLEHHLFLTMQARRSDINCNNFFSNKHNFRKYNKHSAVLLMEPKSDSGDHDVEYNKRKSFQGFVEALPWILPAITFSLVCNN